MGKGVFAESLRAGRFVRPSPDLSFLKENVEVQNGAGEAMPHTSLVSSQGFFPNKPHGQKE